MLPKGAHGCPYLLLAPMEGVGDRPFRKAMQTIGGFDEAVTEFIRVPTNAHVQSLAKVYQANELDPTPLAAQIMGSDLELMPLMAQELVARGAKRIDLNCGCPSKVVTSRGAGSSLLRDPQSVYEVASTLVKAVSVPVTVKMRSGYEDTSLFKENLLAAQESGIRFLTLHPRTKVDGYGPPARWDLIAEAKSLVRIPVVGNGDILSVQDALKMVQETRCDALMIGRGSVINPFLFQQIKAHFSGVSYVPKWEDMKQFFEVYVANMTSQITPRGKINKIKQLMNFLLKGNERRQEVLTATPADLESFLEYLLPLLQAHHQIEKTG